MKTAFALLLAALVALSHAKPVRDTAALQCSLRATGAIVISRVLSKKQNYVTLSDDADLTLIVADAHDTTPQHFTFYNCTATDYNFVGDVGIIQPGVLGAYDAAQQGCVTVTADAPNAVSRLVISECASGAADDKLARQWFKLDDYDEELKRTSLELRGGPDGSYAYRNAATTSWGNKKAVTVTKKFTGVELALV